MRVVNFYPGEIRKATRFSKKFIMAGWTRVDKYITKTIFILCKQPLILCRKLDIWQGEFIKWRSDLLLVYFPAENISPRFDTRPYLTDKIWTNIGMDIAKLNGIQVSWLELAFAERR